MKFDFSTLVKYVIRIAVAFFVIPPAIALMNFAPSAAAYLAVATLSTAVFFGIHRKVREASKFGRIYSLAVTGGWAVALVLQAVISSGAWAYVLIPASILFGTSRYVGLAMHAVAGVFRRRIRGVLAIDDESEFGAAMARKNHEIFVDDADPMLRGDMLKAALKRWPFEKFPSLYQRIREDMRRPVHADDRLVGGETLNLLSPLRFNEGTVIQAYNARLRQGAFTAGVAVVIALMFSATLGASAGKLQSWVMQPQAAMAAFSGVLNAKSAGGAAVPVAVVARGQAVVDPSGVRDFWSHGDGLAAQAEAPRTSTWFAEILGWVAALSASLITFATLAVALSSLIYAYLARQLLSPAAITGAINVIVNRDEALLTVTPRSSTAYAHNIESRNLEYKAYCDAIVEASRDTTPFIPLMRGTPTLLARGFRNSWKQAQVVGLTLAGLRQHLFVFGGTGSGKSFSILLPYLRQIMTHVVPDFIGSVKRPYKFSVIVTDGGGTLQESSIKIARGLGYEVRTIGLGDADCGMDLFEGMDPVSLEQLYEQAESLLGVTAGNDSSWHDGACRQRLACLTVLRAAEATPWGLERAARLGERVYSPIGLSYFYNSTYQKEGLIYEAVKAIIDAVKSPDTAIREAIAPFLTPDLFSRCEFLRQGVFAIPERQFQSQKDHGMKVIEAFNGSPRMRSRFGCCSSVGGIAGSEIFDVDNLWDDRTMTAITPNSATDGSLAIVANVFILTRAIARRTELSITDPTIGDKSITLVISDENQEMVASCGPTATYSLPNFLPRARKTGLAFLCASQGVSTLHKAFQESAGGQQTRSYLAQFRNKVFLSSDDKETSDYQAELASTTPRFYTVGANESYFAIRELQGEDAADDIVPYVYTDVEMDALVRHQPATIAAELKPVVAVDQHFNDVEYRRSQADKQDGVRAPMTDWVEKAKAVVWRAEDKSYQRLSDGRVEEPLVSKKDVLEAGRGIAFCSWIVGAQQKLGLAQTCPELGAAPGVISTRNFAESALPDEVKTALNDAGFSDAAARARSESMRAEIAQIS